MRAITMHQLKMVAIIQEITKVVQDTTSTTTATQNNTGRPTNVRNRGKNGQRDQQKFKGGEKEIRDMSSP